MTSLNVALYEDDFITLAAMKPFYPRVSGAMPYETWYTDNSPLWHTHTHTFVKWESRADVMNEWYLQSRPLQLRECCSGDARVTCSRSITDRCDCTSPIYKRLIGFVCLYPEGNLIISVLVWLIVIKPDRNPVHQHHQIKREEIFHPTLIITADKWIHKNSLFSWGQHNTPRAPIF